MTTHPLLTKVLQRAFIGSTGPGEPYPDPSRVPGIIDSIPHHIAGRLERSLTDCRDCGWPPDAWRHTDLLHRDYHDHVPWVTP